MTFDEVIKPLLAREGGYVNHPDDRGGETYRGIARKFHPSWVGWYHVDSINNTSGRDINSRISWTFLEPFVQDFYRAQFWDRMRLEYVWYQTVANELFDTGVNMGVSVAVTFLQEALNVMNRNGLLFPDLAADGVMGEKTLAALHLITAEDLPLVLVWMNVLQCARYMNLMKKSPDQKVFARGWAKRVLFNL
jgi:lysozyme family protein